MECGCGWGSVKSGARRVEVVPSFYRWRDSFTRQTSYKNPLTRRQIHSWSQSPSWIELVITRIIRDLASLREWERKRVKTSVSADFRLLHCESNELERKIYNTRTARPLPHWVASCLPDVLRRTTCRNIGSWWWVREAWEKAPSPFNSFKTISSNSGIPPLKIPTKRRWDDDETLWDKVWMNVISFAALCDSIKTTRRIKSLTIQLKVTRVERSLSYFPWYFYWPLIGESFLKTIIYNTFDRLVASLQMFFFPRTNVYFDLKSPIWNRFEM